jgi:hypothetical protein
MLLELTTYLISSTANLLSVVTGASPLNVVAVFFLLIATYNVFLYCVYKGVKSTLVSPMFVTITLLYSVFKILGLPDYLVDLVLLFAVLALLSSYWGYSSVRGVFNNATPFVLLASALLGIWVGLATPARYSLASIVDVIVYRLFKERYSLDAILKYFILPCFLTIYLSPALYVNAYVLCCNLFLFLVKVVLHEKDESKTPYVINLDILIKPLVVRWFA